MKYCHSREILLNRCLRRRLPCHSLIALQAAERFGSSCHVAEGLPLIFHLALHAPDYKTAVESNIRAGGDNCGRSIMLGAIVAAHAAMRNPSEFPIPLPWLARYRKFAAAADACAAL